ncbi:hypothetical protein AtNW77_Chr5g0123401 [Arabidopsis thaliana]|uniref:Transmembrane protein n=1 Tax=Arabidopsis thaliana x Arabidopsis arenosa TaxID=1240361 RepID=A0A8T2D394_9BRAS|nr:hypothetical protein ISN45_At05g035550 [Arabidopsis thaliana x Arabidopsis arenosa]
MLANCTENENKERALIRQEDEEEKWEFARKQLMGFVLSSSINAPNALLCFPLFIINGFAL